jgi:hypothetical protein
MSIADTNPRVWMAAHYHLPGLYSCRAPMSSMTSASALPAPSPGTVRLALVRIGIEHFGVEDTRDVPFPIIRAMKIAIRPPERVAFTVQRLRIYKASGEKQDDHLEESIGYREYAHAEGPMTVYVEVSTTHQATFHELLSAIGYWGQASSFAQCLAVEHREPVRSECAVPLREIAGHQQLRPFVTCLISDFRGPDVGWYEILPDSAGDAKGVMQIELYIWPMVIIEQHGEGRVLLRRSLSE